MNEPERTEGATRRRVGMALVAAGCSLLVLMVAGRFGTLGYLGKRVHVGTSAGSLCIAVAAEWDGQHWFADTGWFAYPVEAWDWWRWTAVKFAGTAATPTAPAYGPAYLLFTAAWVAVLAVGVPGTVLWRRGVVLGRVGMCVKGGYSRDGLTEGVVCPECGE